MMVDAVPGGRQVQTMVTTESELGTWRRMVRLLASLSLVIISLLGFAGIAVGFALNATQPLQAGLLFGFSSALIGYVVTAGLHNWIIELGARETLKALLKEQIRTVVTDVQKEAYTQMARQFPKLLPSGYFPPSNLSNPDFERELAETIAQTRNYFFRGVTARHVPIYLERTKPSNLHATILMLDPREQPYLQLYVNDRFGDASMSSDERAALLGRVKRESYSAIVALFDVRHLCPIEIKLHRGPVYYRAEILDDRCFVAYYVGSPRTTYAVTYTYERGTFFYEAFYKDAFHCLQLDGPSIEFNGQSQEDELAKFLVAAGCDVPAEELRREFNAFKESFIARK